MNDHVIKSAIWCDIRKVAVEITPEIFIDLTVFQSITIFIFGYRSLISGIFMV